MVENIEHAAFGPMPDGSQGQPAQTDHADAACPFCGTLYHFDEGRRCWTCGSPACEHCATPGPEPLCPECVAAAPDADADPPSSGSESGAGSGLDSGNDGRPSDGSPPSQDPDADPLPPTGLAPMLATPAELPPDPSGWAFELKWDGLRCLAYWDGARLKLMSRNGNAMTERWPEVADLARVLAGTPPVVFDGEIVALDQRGHPSFERLARRMQLGADAAVGAAERRPVHYFVFDLLYADGRSLLARPYRERRMALAHHLPAHPHLHLPPSEAGAGEAMLATARKQKLEGIVAKRLDSPYEPGRRSPAWRKIKLVRMQEMVIGGWMPGGGAPDLVGSLLLGVYDDTGVLRYAGRAGTGFTQADRSYLHEVFGNLARDTSPFDQPRPVTGARFVEPRLVAQIAYRRWPADGHIQQASFKGLRSDVPAAEVVREQPGGEV
ncbi:non-homologous end-joining DNA ligase [Thiohalocapsa sp. ML1]|jgi:bifunctional non-homologous end joining protein LigD|uniref:non-homologous end-joining DNA ligase n=1 Tax=Thiohalocapsa sp. ML1 TaxID=1431688 RepID=UPI0007320E3F|nr:non-homologous end-joining DNA ligase [Thiohalocapsa sp. ML1]